MAEPSLPAVTGRHLVWLAVAAVLVVVPYGVGVLVPYFVNGLHQLPLSEVASGAHDPKDLWPQEPLSGWISLVGVLAVGTTPLLLLCLGLVATGAAAWGFRRRPGRPCGVVIVGLVVLAVACGAAVVWLLGSTGQALAAWRVD